MNLIDGVVQILGSPKSTRGFMVGWISPEGDFMTVEMYNHFPELKRRGLYPELFAKLEEAIENEREDEYNFLQGCGEDEHIPWHCYYSEWDDVKQNTKLEIINRAYTDGWVRIGFSKMRTETRDKPHRVLELEGTVNRLKELKKDAEFLAETYEAELFLKTR